MYSYEDRKRAVELYIKYDRNIAAVIHELGYPSRQMLYLWYKEFTAKGEISPEVENLVNRDFSADTPNSKWLTDITEFSIAAGKVYLSPIIDCFDGMAVSWTIGTAPDAELVNSMLDAAVSLLDDQESPTVHTDRGGHYRWPGWIERMQQAGLTRSMSKKGCTPDNAACEGFFGRIKNEMFYGRFWFGISLDEFINTLDSYLRSPQCLTAPTYSSRNVIWEQSHLYIESFNGSFMNA